MTPSSKYPVRNLQRPPSMTLRTVGSRHTYMDARELRFGTQVKNHISWWSLMSRTSHPRSHTWKMMMVLDWILGGWGHSWHLGSSWYVILDLCAKSQLSSMYRSVSRTLRPWSHTWRTLKVPDWILGGWGHSWYHGSSWYGMLVLCAKFQRVSRMPLSLKSYLKNLDGSWMDTWRMESFLTSWIVMICDSWLPNLSSVAWLEGCQEPPILEVHIWRMLMVPDWRLGE